MTSAWSARGRSCSRSSSATASTVRPSGRKPGITGLWQVSGRSDTTYDERVRLDVSYVRNWNTLLDLWILVRTVVTVVAQARRRMTLAG